MRACGTAALHDAAKRPKHRHVTRSFFLTRTLNGWQYVSQRPLPDDLSPSDKKHAHWPQSFISTKKVLFPRSVLCNLKVRSRKVLCPVQRSLALSAPIARRKTPERGGFVGNVAGHSGRSVFNAGRNVPLMSVSAALVESMSARHSRSSSNSAQRVSRKR